MNTKMTNESLETQASIMLKNAADHLEQRNLFAQNSDHEAILLLDTLSTEVYFSASWTFGEPLY